MRKRNRNGKYAPFVFEFAELYVRNGHNAAATAEAIREDYAEFPKFSPDLISDWLRTNCHGFADEVAEAEKRMGLRDETEIERWLRDEMGRMEQRKRWLEEMFDEELVSGRQTTAMRLGHEMMKMSRVIRDLQRDYLAYQNNAVKHSDDGVEKYRRVIRECNEIHLRELEALRTGQEGGEDGAELPTDRC